MQKKSYVSVFIATDRQGQLAGIYFYFSIILLYIYIYIYM